MEQARPAGDSGFDGAEQAGPPSDAELVQGFLAAEDEERDEWGRLVMGRLVEKVGLPEERLDYELVGAKGKLMGKDGKVLTVRDYLQVADEHGATPAIIGFLSDPEMAKQMAPTMAGMLEGYSVPPKPVQGDGN